MNDTGDRADDQAAVGAVDRARAILDRHDVPAAPEELAALAGLLAAADADAQELAAAVAR